LRPKVKSGIIQARFDIGADAKEDLFSVAKLLGTDATQLIRAVILQTAGQWRQLYVAQIKHQATSEDIAAAKRLVETRERLAEAQAVAQNLNPDPA
jgi:hypothetical protein